MALLLNTAADRVQAQGLQSPSAPDALQLNPDELCDGDTISMDRCLEEQVAKADRWRQAIVNSYSQMALADMKEMSAGDGSAPFDTVAQLTKSEEAFEHYRQEASGLVAKSGLFGSGNKLFALQAAFRLTIDHARFLLEWCSTPIRRRLGESVDLTKTDWCVPGGAN
jgi:hypothetical protein